MVRLHWFTDSDMANSFSANIIAGPCSAESRQQVLDAAKALSECGIARFRAGLWKPRTRPGGFEGVGEEGIAWMKEARERYAVRIYTEVASQKHVELCLDAGFDGVWIGARTSGNPFVMDEIADALKGSQVEVLLKNPLSPDAALWVGAAERLERRGVGNLTLVHRGFAEAGNSRWRNAPCWQISAEMRRLCPGVPLYCDPSHISGCSADVPELCRTAVNMGFDGLMVECHPYPESALSDAGQQLTPSELSSVLEELTVRSSASDDSVFNAALQTLRSEMDELDSKLVANLSERMKLSREIGDLKQKKGVAIVQSSRWEKVLSNALETAKNLGLDQELVKKIFEEIHEASILMQK